MQRSRDMSDREAAGLWTARFEQVRRRTLQLCAPLSVEDQLVQPMADASPSKWHLAHTTWFFESFVLGAAGASGASGASGAVAVFDPAFTYLFNSYYDAIGPRVERPRRGMLSRPSLERVREYRAAVDARMVQALAHSQLDAAALERLELGLHHEQQHQELILTDIKYVLGTQPTRPAYHSQGRSDQMQPSMRSPMAWRSFDGGIYEIGAGAGDFSFDNERPRHRVLVPPFRLATRPVSNGDVLAFIAAGGYRDAQWWLSDGWHAVQSERWAAPLYWELGEDGAGACLYELAGVRAVDPGEPACHLSYYEADAIARWSGARLPTEQEWEVAAQLAGGDRCTGNFADDDRLHPSSISSIAAGQAQRDDTLLHLFGDVWEWTSSSYTSYPGFRPLAGALGEYNGKFMSGQQVLRGGSCFTPRDHLRVSYRNFFPPAARWQMTGVRLAADGPAPSPSEH